MLGIADADVACRSGGSGNASVAIDQAVFARARGEKNKAKFLIDDDEIAFSSGTSIKLMTETAQAVFARFCGTYSDIGLIAADARASIAGWCKNSMVAQDHAVLAIA
mmetsp:Transcript_91989/g.260391  ORF Transcript_91989/g.260391 Transcript_91989/m.260391 type:complete len:107 (-) Transcript_91989:905-1225(-)